MYRKYLRLKGCPRCHGDLLIDRAYDELNEVCIQCGYRGYDNITKESPVKAKMEKSAAIAKRKSTKQVA